MPNNLVLNKLLKIKKKMEQYSTSQSKLLKKKRNFLSYHSSHDYKSEQKQTNIAQFLFLLFVYNKRTITASLAL